MRPDGTDNTISVARDDTYVFSIGDFGFSDVDGDNLSLVQFTGPASAGTLFIDANNDNVIDGGEAITGTHSVSATVIGNGRLKFQPNAGDSGAGYATIDFQVIDDGSTANGGVTTDPTANTITIDVTDAYRIEGNIFEDVNGDSQTGDAVAVNNATVHLYEDTDSDGLISAADSLVASTTTDASGNYRFSSLLDDTYFVVVDSRTIAPSAGLNATYTQTDVWAEQTYGVTGAADGSGFLAADGALFGGRTADVSDDASSLLTAEHVTRVSVSGSDVANIDSGFSFNVVTGVRDGDDVGGEGRSVQGSLRQFVDNANAISGDNAMRFVPGVATNSAGSGGNWWTITLASQLSDLDDNGTTVDGTAFDSADGTTVLDSNSGNASTATAVGVDGLTLDAVERQELEIFVNGADDGIVVSADNITVADLAIYGADNNSSTGAQIKVTTNSDTANGEATITRTVIGARADGTDPGVTSGWTGMLINGAASVTNNFIAFTEASGVRVNGLAGGNSDAVTFENNEIAFVGGSHNAGDGLTVDSANVTVRGNWIHDVAIMSDVRPFNGKGIELWYNANNNLIENNTITNAITAGIGIGGDAFDNTIRRNVVTGTTGNAGDGGAGILSTNSAGNPTNNVFSENSLYGNASIGIDLDPRTDATTSFGDGVTINDGDLTPGSTNQLIDSPVISNANLVGGNLQLSGFVGAAANDTDFAGARVEFFVSDGSGEGQTYLGFALADANGNFAITLTGAGVTDADSIVATATLTGVGTSEFGSEFGVNVRPVNTIPADQNVNEDTLLPISGLSVSDVDANISSVQLTVSDGNIAVALQGGAAFAAGASGTSTFTLSGTAADINATLATLSYQGNLNFNGTDTLVIVTTDAGGLSDSDSFDINVAPVNDQPVITDLAGDTLTYSEGDGAVVIDQATTALVSDVDSADFDGGILNVAFQSGSDSSEDVLSIANQGTGIGQIGISGTDVSYEGTVIGAFTGGTGGSDLVITLDSDATTAATTALIQAITFENTNTDDPTAGNRTVRFVLTDGDGGTSLGYDTTVNVVPVNDSPIVTTNLPLNVNEGSTGNVIGNAFLAATDVDDSAGGLTYTVTGLPSNGTLFVGGVAITATGQTFTQADLDGGQVTYSHNDSETTSDSFTFDLADGGEDGATIDSGTFNISVTLVNDNSISAIVDADAGTNQVAENSAVGTSVGVTAFASDTDLGDTVTYSLDDDASGRFQIDVNSGVVTVAGGIDHETTTSHSITVRATSTDGSSVTQNFTINVIDVNDNAATPIVDTDPGLEVVLENSAVGTPVGFTALSGDADSFDSITYSLDDNDGGRFAIDAVTGLVTVDGAIDRESDGPMRSIIVRATSTDGTWQTQVVNIVVTDVNEFGVGPLADVDVTANVVAENSAVGTVVGLDIDAFDNDATNNTITYSLIDSAGGRFVIDTNTGVVTVNGSVDFESSASHSVTVQADSSDGSSATASFTINVQDVNEAPQAVDDAFAIDQGGVLTFTPDPIGNDFDPEGSTLSINILIGPANGVLAIDVFGNLVYTPDPTFYGTDTIVYQTTDGLLLSNSATIEITVSPLGGSSTGSGPDPNPDPNPTPVDSTPSGDNDNSDDSENETLAEASDTSTQITNSRESDAVDSEEPEVVLAAFRIDDEFAIAITSDEALQRRSRELMELFSRSAVMDETSFRSLQELELARLLQLDIDQAIQWQQWDEMEMQKDDPMQTFYVGSVGVTAGLVSVGYVMWAIRGGAFLAAITSSMPAWRMIDPVSILSAYQSARTRENDKIERLIG